MKREEILDTAKRCVCGDREQDYGTPEDNFGLIADLWSVYTGHNFTPVDVAMMMAMLKTPRFLSFWRISCLPAAGRSRAGRMDNHG